MTTEKRERTLEQKRADHALSAARAVESNKRIDPAAYRSYVERLATSIVMNGLGQSLAMERAAAGKEPKNGDEWAHMMLYIHLSDWLCNSEGAPLHGFDDALDGLVKKDQQTYLRAQAEALAWAEWHKRFCQAFLPRREEV